MSRIYFHSEHDEAEINGSERAWCGSLVNRIALGLVEASGFDARRTLAPLITPGHYLNNVTDANWAQSFEATWGVGGMFGSPITWRGRQLSTLTISLNTTLAVGSDPVKLAARLHGQCEIHTWVDGPNRAWLADIIDRGLASGVFRSTLTRTDRNGNDVTSSQGWEQVTELLRSRNDGPVVTSYSVCDQFPNPGVGWMPDWPAGVAEDWRALSKGQQQVRSARQSEWYELDDEQKWRIAMDGLRADVTSELELKPDD